MADGDGALGSGEADQRGGPGGHPADDVREGVTAPAGLRPDGRQAELERGDAAPGGGEVAAAAVLLEQLEVRGGRRVVGDDGDELAGRQGRPERVPVGLVADRRAALEGGVAVRHVLGREGEVVRAGLGRHPDAVLARLAQQRQHGGGGDVQDVDPGAGAAGGVQQPRDGRGLGRVGAGGEEVAVVHAGLLRGGLQHGWVLGVDDRQRADPGLLGEGALQVGLLDVRELVHAGGGEEALEAEDAGPVQRLQVSGVAGDRAAPEAEVDPGLALGGLPLGVQAVDRGGRRDRVQRHVDDGGDTPGGGGPGGGGEALPLGAAGLVDVHVGVDQAGQQGGVTEVGQQAVAGRQRAVGGDLLDPPVPDQHVSGALAVGEDHSAGADHHGGGWRLAGGHRDLRTGRYRIWGMEKGVRERGVAEGGREGPGRQLRCDRHTAGCD